jgi:hypothetical protein
MTVKDVAKNEGVGVRQIQRYISLGFKGHKLLARKRSKGYWIEESDYRAWRVACGFDPARVSPEDTRPAPAPSGDAHTATAEDAHPVALGHRIYPPYPFPADPNGVITNVPDAHSCTMPHPQAVRDYFEAQARKMKETLYGGMPDEYSD